MSAAGAGQEPGAVDGVLGDVAESDVTRAEATRTVAVGLDVLRLLGVRATGHHGVFDHERRDGQEFVIDAVVHLDTTSAADDDDLAQTVHYGVLAEQLVAAVERDPVDLIETLAERLAALVLSHPAAARVELTVHKPSAPITVPFGDVSITVVRERA